MNLALTLQLDKINSREPPCSTIPSASDHRNRRLVSGAGENLQQERAAIDRLFVRILVKDRTAATFATRHGGVLLSFVMFNIKGR